MANNTTGTEEEIITTTTVLEPINAKKTASLKNDEFYALVLKVAMTLYSYTDFSKVTSIKDEARKCIDKAEKFAEVWDGYHK